MGLALALSRSCENMGSVSGPDPQPHTITAACACSRFAYGNAFEETPLHGTL